MGNNDYIYIKNIKEEDAKKNIFSSIQVTCNDYSQVVNKEQLEYMTDRIYHLSCIYNYSVHNIRLGFRELINNYTAYRTVNVASIITACNKAKNT
jgi:hypothetical protein